MTAKHRAAEAALQFVSSGMVVGLGTGSTADCFLVALADAIRAGRLGGIRGVPTSRQSEKRAGELGIPLLTLADALPDVTIDGADEIAPNLDLIKGLGGALLREKIVAQNSRRLVIIADSSKLVAVLGTRSPLSTGRGATPANWRQRLAVRHRQRQPDLRLPVSADR